MSFWSPVRPKSNCTSAAPPDRLLRDSQVVSLTTPARAARLSRGGQGWHARAEQQAGQHRHAVRQVVLLRQGPKGGRGQ
jgi:hypothetical protein